MTASCGRLATRHFYGVEEAFQFALAVATEDSGKSGLIDTSRKDGRTGYSSVSAVGDIHSVVGPEIDTRLEAKMRDVLRGFMMRRAWSSIRLGGLT